MLSKAPPTLTLVFRLCQEREVLCQNDSAVYLRASTLFCNGLKKGSAVGHLGLTLLKLDSLLLKLQFDLGQLLFQSIFLLKKFDFAFPLNSLDSLRKERHCELLRKGKERSRDANDRRAPEDLEETIAGLGFFDVGQNSELLDAYLLRFIRHLAVADQCWLTNFTRQTAIVEVC